MSYILVQKIQLWFFNSCFVKVKSKYFIFSDFFLKFKLFAVDSFNVMFFVDFNIVNQ